MLDSGHPNVVAVDSHQPPAAERLIADGRREVFPATAYAPLIEGKTPFAVEGEDLPWVEIDSLEDFEQAVARVLPFLAAG